MASIDEELIYDAEEDARIVSFIQTALPTDLKETFSEDDIYYFLDVMAEYYAESGILEQQPDKDGFVEIDLEKVAAYMAQKARKEGIGTFNPDDLLFIVQLHMDYEDADISANVE